MSKPVRFAAALPVGAWHPLFPASLESLAKQDMPLEVALLDASGDERVVAAADASGIKFAYRRHGPDEGQAAAIAEGWLRTSGDVVFWLNADDTLMPGALDVVANAFMEDQSVDVVYGDSIFVDREGAMLGVHEQVAEISPLLLRSNIISQPSCFLRRDAMERVGGVDPSLHFVMDWDLWVRLYRSGARFRRLDVTLSSVYFGDGTKTGRISLRRLAEVFSIVFRNAGTYAALKSTCALMTETLRSRGASL